MWPECGGRLGLVEGAGVPEAGAGSPLLLTAQHWLHSLCCLPSCLLSHSERLFCILHPAHAAGPTPTPITAPPPPPPAPPANICINTAGGPGLGGLGRRSRMTLIMRGSRGSRLYAFVGTRWAACPVQSPSPSVLCSPAPNCTAQPSCPDVSSVPPQLQPVIASLTNLYRVRPC